MKQEYFSIQDGIYYVGVNDRKKPLFENMWPLPYGVSYNSYLIVDDDKVALIDTVDVAFFEQFMKKIHSIIGDRKIDYLIINHMEPDHSGSLKLFHEFYPDITIVGNRLTLGMIKGYYGVTGNNIQVTDGYTIDLGHHNLHFYLTPMVHWPETMMTFDEQTGALFSGDAFGAFGTLNGGFIDTKIDTSYFNDEMTRYYACIVGKYGTPVQNALKKVKDLGIKYICSTHGPVWTGSNVTEVIGNYDRMSRYDTGNGVVIVYGSMYGHTEEMAEVIAAELAAKGISPVKIYDISHTHVSYILRDVFNYKGLIIGSPTYSGQIYPGIEALLSKLSIREIKNHYVGLFSSYTWASAALRRMIAWAKETNMELIDGSVEMKQAMDESEEEKAIQLADRMAEKLLNS
jgi:flavorubredoxin